MGKLIERGDLVRWVVDYEYFAADEIGMAYPFNPIYEYGIVIEVSEKDSNAVIIYNPKQAEWCIGDLYKDNIQVISKAKKMKKQKVNSVEVVTLNKQKRETRWLCAHCKTGMVYRIPSECPECGKLLNEEVKRQNA